ncbi:MAG: hypothetical protein U1E26_08750 [Coriobacteriia bacterium]|nr:hypothetical protein [Coriobacteriia bacterium]
MDDEQRSEYESPLSRLDREVLRTYAGRGDVTPLDAGDMSRSKEYDKEIKSIKGEQRKMLLKGYFALIVIIIMGGLIIWQVYLWSTEALETESLMDRARTGTEKINPLSRDAEE